LDSLPAADRDLGCGSKRFPHIVSAASNDMSTSGAAVIGHTRIWPRLLFQLSTLPPISSYPIMLPLASEYLTGRRLTGWPPSGWGAGCCSAGQYTSVRNSSVACSDLGGLSKWIFLIVGSMLGRCWLGRVLRARKVESRAGS
jgi:hypothetical protein